MSGSLELISYASAVASESALFSRAKIAHPTTDPNRLRADAAIDGSAGTMATAPTLAAPQRLSARVTIGGFTLDRSLIRAISVVDSIDAMMQVWSIELTLSTPDGPIGNPFDHSGPATCLNDVSIYGVYHTPTGVHEIPLVRNAVGHSERRSSSNGFYALISGVDAGGRWSRETIDLILPNGHGLTRRRVIEVGARRAGVESISLEDPWPGQVETLMMKPVQITDANPFTVLQELADVDLRRIGWDRDGAMVWIRSGRPGDNERTAWTLNEASWKPNTVNTDHNGGDVITRVVVDGEAQLPSGPCGDVTTSTRFAIKGLNGPVRLAFEQNADGTYDPLPALTPWTAVDIVRLEIIDKTERCGVLVGTRRRAYEYHVPEAARYEFDPLATGATADGWAHLATTFTNDDGSGDDPAYQQEEERWRLVEVDQEGQYWNSIDHAGPLLAVVIGGASGAVDFRFARGDNPDGDFRGVKIGSLSVSWRWSTPQRAIKTRAVTSYPLDPWEERTPGQGLTGLTVYGDKRGVIDNPNTGSWSWIPWSYYADGPGPVNGAKFLPVSAVATLLESDGRGFLVHEESYKFEWAARSGVQFQMADGTETSEEEESFRYVGSDATLYVGSGESSHDEIEISTDLDGATIGGSDSLGLDGYLPAIDRIPDLGTVDVEDEPDVYADSSELDEVAKRALLTDGKPFSVEVVAEDLEDCHVVNRVKLHAPWAESEQEAERMAYDLIDRSAAAKVSGELRKINFFMRRGDVARVACRPIGLPYSGNKRCRITSVTFSWQAGDSWWSQSVTGDVYGW
jgi:hypothetical protein